VLQMSMSLKTPSKELTKQVLTSGVTLKQSSRWRWRKSPWHVFGQSVPQMFQLVSQQQIPEKHQESHKSLRLLIAHSAHWVLIINRLHYSIAIVFTPASNILRPHC
jgi:hypothetical protein